MQSTFIAYVPKINEASTYAERFSFGLQTLGLGMLIIFASLILIWLILELFHKVFDAFQMPKVTDLKPADPTVITPPQPKTDDAAIVAAITAAISACTDQPTTAFRVVSFRRASKHTPWNQK